MLWVCLPYPPAAPQSLSLVQPQPPWVGFSYSEQFMGKTEGDKVVLMCHARCAWDCARSVAAEHHPARSPGQSLYDLMGFLISFHTLM